MKGVYDRKRAIHDMAKNEDVDVITGDWMSEANMTLRGSDKREKMASGTLVGKAYEPYFLEELDPAIPWLAKRGVKIAVNAGASDVQGLAEAVRGLVKKHGVDLKVGYVDGDDVTDAVLDLYKKGELSFLPLEQCGPNIIQARNFQIYPQIRIFKNGDMNLFVLNATSEVPELRLFSLEELILLFAAEWPMPVSQWVPPCGGTAGQEITSKNLPER